METKAQTILDDAEAQVRQWLFHVDAEVAALKSAAQQSGESQGYEQAQMLNQKLDILRDTMLKEAAHEITRTASEIARNLLDAEMSAFDDSIVRVVHEVLTTIPDAKQVYLRVNPGDVESLKRNKERLIHALERAKDIDIRADKQVERGGVLVQTESGVIDAQLSTQIGEIFRAIGGPNGANN